MSNSNVRLVILDRDGVINEDSDAFVKSADEWIPLPERFQGNYYCHLVAPAYLESIIRGESRIQS